MSSGMLLLAGLFATGPVTAPPCETAPMPRAKRGTMQVELRFDFTSRGLALGAGVGPVKPPLEPYNVEPRTEVLPPFPPQVHNLPRFPTVTVCPGPLNGPPPEVHAMMLQVMGQMGAPVAAPLQPTHPRPAFVTPVFEGGGNSHPVPFEQFMVEHARPAHPARITWTAPAQPLACLAAPAPLGPPAPMGTWNREVGPVRYKVEIKELTLVLTATLTEDEENGKSVSIDHVLTADWFPTRNPGEIVGLITGFDITTNGKAMKREDVSGLLGSLADIQKQLTGKPIAMKWGGSDGTLTIGDVRLPALKDDYSELSAAFAALGGNYKSPSAVTLIPATYKGQPPPLTEIPTFTPLHSNFDKMLPRVPPMPLPVALPKSNPFRNGGY